MLKNNILLGLRNLRKNKGFSLLNVFGLALGITSALLIGLWIKNELSYNRFHEKYDRIYSVLLNHGLESGISTWPATQGPLAEAMLKELPEVQNAVRVDWGSQWAFAYKDKVMNGFGYQVDPSFLEIFTFPLVKGQPFRVLNDMHSIVITERMAKNFFGDEDPIGKALKVNGAQEYIVTGVLKDLPQSNNTLRLDWLTSLAVFEKENTWMTSWGATGVETFVEIKPGANISALNIKMEELLKQKQMQASEGVFDASTVPRPFLHPMKDWRLYSKFENGKQAGGRIEYVRLFGIIAIVIIIIACINFMNLATARSEQRAKEIGVRKVIGATRAMLIGQLMVESLLLALISTGLAIVLTYIVLPPFNSIVEKELMLDLTDPVILTGLVLVAIVSGLLSGSYPAFYLSSIKPVRAFKRMFAGKASSAVLIRKWLVVAQFIAGIVLIICTIVVYLQLQHVKSRDIGYIKNNVISMQAKGDMAARIESIRNALAGTGVVESSATGVNDILELGTNRGDIMWKGKREDLKVQITWEWISPGYLPVFGMEIREGRDFYPTGSSDSMNVIVNETFAKMITKGSAIGEVITVDRTEKYTIVGVVKDFVYQDMYASPPPLVFTCSKMADMLYIRLKDGNEMASSLKKIEAVMKQHNPFIPFEYTFLSDAFDKKFKTETLISDLSRIFAALAIFISCIGLFGLSAYTAERRTKEIGIRKVLGASVSSIVIMLSKDFLKLVLIAAVVAFPIAWWIMSGWLQDYKFRIDIPYWAFGVAGICALAVALFTMSFQGFKAARQNPVSNLRSE